MKQIEPTIQNSVIFSQTLTAQVQKELKKNMADSIVDEVIKTHKPIQYK